ncbi:MAG: aminomethyl-transferring glycine dehydrogenase [Acidimicrobiia bacterium]|nr:aminomethyl-transferring glycine dehydrogenase [Acidimicrobiia bacterium]
MMFDAEPFQSRHIGPDPNDAKEMLAATGAGSLDALIAEAIPSRIRLGRTLNLPTSMPEHEYLRDLRDVAGKNQAFRSYIGLGYYDCVTPSVILRNVLENPSWYTPYTPYQAEIAQGRLEALLNFQTMVRDLTGMEVATASLLDEATAGGEAMTMLHRVHPQRDHADVMQFLVANSCFPQTIDVIRSRAEPLGIEVVVADVHTTPLTERMFGAIVQTPDEGGVVHDFGPFIVRARAAGLLVAVATDLLSLTLLTPPGEWGADVVLGNSQRFGVPMGYGGPHAAFFATLEKHVRQAPGRIIGVSVDAHGHPAYRMSLQTREQHIRREKATSNICTAQALLANMAGFYAVYHGPRGLTNIARRVHATTKLLARELGRLGVRQVNPEYFDTIKLEGVDRERLKASAVAARQNFRYRADGSVNIAVDETTNLHDVENIVRTFAAARGLSSAQFDKSAERLEPAYSASLARTSPFLTHPVFNTHHSESEMMRYIRSLDRKDIGLDRSMIPLGSCTMKLNAASEMLPLTWPEFSKPHPFAPIDQTEGYQQIFRELEAALREITGFAAVSLQPNSGAQGEYAGLMVIRAYHRSRGDSHRNVVLIPASAHGTNPASAVMAGMRVVVVASTRDGSIDVEDLAAKTQEHARQVAALMVTYPSTHGVFEESIQDICAIVHRHGGQVYMDGANMNAQVGLTSPSIIGADVCHLNLHKTFAIPHGGGGPGMGPIGVAAHLAPFLPKHPLVPTGGAQGINAVSAAPWGSSSILLISYGYIRMLGGAGMTEATKVAILSANYMKARLEPHFPVLYARANGRVAHELIFDLRSLKQASGIDETDVAKRLMDFGFHAPTVSFPVAGTLMVEPTESEPKEELDRFCDAMIKIRREIQDVIEGKADPKDNVLKHAPHTAAAVAGSDWPHAYSREEAAFPLPYLRTHKFWPSVGRIDNPYGDRNLMCACPPVEVFADTTA